MDTPVKKISLVVRPLSALVLTAAACCLMAGTVAAQQNSYEGLTPEQIQSMAHSGMNREATGIQAQMDRYYSGVMPQVQPTPAPVAGSGVMNTKEAGKTIYRYDKRQRDPFYAVMPERLFHNIPPRRIPASGSK